VSIGGGGGGGGGGGWGVGGGGGEGGGKTNPHLSQRYRKKNQKQEMGRQEKKNPYGEKGEVFKRICPGNKPKRVVLQRGNNPRGNSKTPQELKANAQIQESERKSQKGR